MLLVVSTEIIAQVMNALISRLVVSGKEAINNANSHGEPISVPLKLSQISVLKVIII